MSANRRCESASAFQRLLRNSLAALLLCGTLVVIGYCFVDRPVAFYVHRQRFADFAVLKWLTYPPPVLQAWAPALLAVLMVRRAWGPFYRWERVLVAAGVGIILADQSRQTLAYVFGRYWPDTWTLDNPSLIRDDAYGFHPFHYGIAFDSFPSGHAARTLALVAVVWVAWPGWRWACGLAAAAEAVALIGLNYHFVSDVIAGGFVGGIVGAYTACCTGLAGPNRLVPQPAGPDPFRRSS
jgi:membrane-associated phospholipid phosphatase